ncbi:phosphatase PAP2 family protein [Agrilactobacillus fermenti]|uniref:phosphatase PAP2 family protein n=1 Tax=Agrilactobacillus fermenti TaxID=2586909 RepID=UPI001E366D36|nr:phosphatase PAP2 family protein [Agrilactobacillus fermenti]MCD2257149.1 phosphatase PAP2 family protein [Agrilactobacillus fermenti]
MTKLQKHLAMIALVSYLIFSFILISLLTKQPLLIAFDQWGHRTIASLHHPELTPIIRIITYSAQNGITIVIASLFIISTWLTHKKVLGFFLTQNLIVGNLLNHGVKLLIQRQRPALTQLVPQGGYSFPSGHSANAVLLYGSLLFIAWYFIRQRKNRILLSLFVIFWIFLVGCSRIYLQVHFPSDVLAGWSLALGNLIVSFRISQPYLRAALPDDAYDIGPIN